MKRRYSFLLLILVLCLPTVGLAQEQPLVLLDYTASGNQYLNALIAADTAANGWNPNRVYVLKRDGIYLANASFRVPSGATFHIRSDNNKAAHYPPTIFLYPTGTGANPQNPPGNWIDLRGTLKMKDILLSGYYEPIDSNLNNLQGALISVPTAGVGANIYIDSCILKSTNGNHIRTDGAPGNIKVTNTIIADMGFEGRSNFGAGKGFDVRNVSVDTFLVENCTFVNWQDRVIRHYQSTAPIKYLQFNHNTLLNGMSYHGTLALGRVGWEVSITNNLLLDPFMLGNDTDAVRQSEFGDHGEKDAYGGNRMTWVIANPNDTTKWTVEKNYYGISDSGQAFYNQFASAGVTGEGSPLTWHINQRLAALGKDSTKAFEKVNLRMTKVPKLMTVLGRWYRDPAGANKTKATTTFIKTPDGKWKYDYDRRSVEYYLDTLNCSFAANKALTTTDSKVAGDPRWTATVGVEDIGLIPAQYSLEQNFPNPFNPSTEIRFSLPIKGNVTLKVYDLLGRQVASLVDGVMDAGSHTATWSASNFSTGLYFYTLRSEQVSITKKMMLVK